MPSKSVAQARLMANGLDSVKKYADGGKVKPSPVTSADIDGKRVPEPGTGAIRNERTGQVTQVGKPKRYANGGKVKAGTDEHPMRVNPGMDMPVGGAMTQTPHMVTKDTEAQQGKNQGVNIHGVRLHAPMSMRAQREARG